MPPNSTNTSITEEYGREAFDMTLDASKQLSDTHLFPYYTEMDKQKAYFENGSVKVHPQLKSIIKAIAEGGWISANKSFEAGGQQMPLTLLNAALLIMYGANANAAAYAFLTQGASKLIQSFGSEELKAKYIPRNVFRRLAGNNGIDRTSGRKFTHRSHLFCRIDRRRLL